MQTIALSEFRANASAMIDLVEHGETVRILRHGKPVAELVPVRAAEPGRVPSWKRPIDPLHIVRPDGKTGAQLGRSGRTPFARRWLCSGALKRRFFAGAGLGFRRACATALEPARTAMRVRALRVRLNERLSDAPSKRRLMVVNLRAYEWMQKKYSRTWMARLSPASRAGSVCQHTCGRAGRAQPLSRLTWARAGAAAGGRIPA